MKSFLYCSIFKGGKTVNFRIFTGARELLCDIQIVDAWSVADQVLINEVLITGATSTTEQHITQV